MTTRTEHDLLGAMEVPADAYYGIHTARAMENFPLSGLRLHPELIRALAVVKKAAALDEPAHRGCSRRTRRRPSARPATKSPKGGARISSPSIRSRAARAPRTNMNVNEVIANRAIELLGGAKGDYAIDPPERRREPVAVHERRLPDRGEAGGDPPAAARDRGHDPPAGRAQEKEAEFAGVLKVGRTEMQDAVPITLGQEFSAWAQAVQRDWWRLHVVEEKLRQVNLGGTAVGTGLNADRGTC